MSPVKRSHNQFLSMQLLALLRRVKDQKEKQHIFQQLRQPLQSISKRYGKMRAAINRKSSQASQKKGDRSLHQAMTTPGGRMNDSSRAKSLPAPSLTDAGPDGADAGRRDGAQTGA